MDERVGEQVDEIVDHRRERMERAVATWVRQLVDLTGRNQLLYYRHLARGTLELTDAEAGPLAALLAGRAVRLSQLVPPTGARQSAEVDPEVHLDIEAGGDVAAAAARAMDAQRRARTVHTRARELYEERGIETLHLALGMASWTSSTSSATPNAPLVLRPLAVRPVGAAAADHELQLAGDWGINATLLHLLEEDFSVRLDAEVLLETALGDDGGLRADGLDALAAALARQAADVPDLRVHDRVVVGTFSYTKLPMVQDLRGALDELVGHDLLAALVGDPDGREALQDTDTEVALDEPDRTAPADELLVLDADSSQQRAINEVLAGRSLVLQGPPGTGKSQTIANLIAVLAAHGRRVLFVAEKRAAIDAVTKRLHALGLGELVMDLHGGTGSRRQLAEDLAHTLERLVTTPATDDVALHERLATAREQLGAHVRALHEPRAPWGLSVWQLRDRLQELPPASASALRLDAPALAVLDAATARTARATLGELRELLQPLLDSISPWSGAVVADDALAQELVGRLAIVGGGLGAAVAEDLVHVARVTGLPAPPTLAGWRAHLDLLARVDTTLRTLGAEAYARDLDALATALAPAGSASSVRRAVALLSGAYRAALREVRGLVRAHGGDEPPAATPSACLAAVRAAREELADWRATGAAPPPVVPADLDEIAAQVAQLLEVLVPLDAALGDRPLSGEAPEALVARVERLRADQRTLLRLPHVHALTTWCRQHHLGPLLDLLERGEVDRELLVDVFDHAWVSSILLGVSASDPHVAAFDGGVQADRVASFQQADRDHLAASVARVRRAVAEHATVVRDRHREQDRLVGAQARRKRGHLPLRELLAQAQDVLLSLRPCWAMSPLVVAQTLPARPVFDVVVFDEASQVLPADAVCALLRGRQAVVAGDDRQLPPTMFFDTQRDDDEDDEALTAGFESILDVLGSLLGSRRLDWHYRSRDERLIAFSNHAIYGGEMTTFPGVGGSAPLRHELVAHRPASAEDTRSNADEVRRVVELVVEHAHERPDESLGVIAMGQHHAERIEDALRERAASVHDPALEALLGDAREERTFVKNLERVQGDERDAIILTIGYGKQHDGRLLYRFGPLNADGGERRLNVAVTRARNRLTLVSSFSYTDMAEGRSSARGVELLRAYLRYAASGGDEVPGAPPAPRPGPVEQQVVDRLRAEGMEVVAKLGASGMRIDAALVHPDDPTRFALGVLTDGPDYRAAATVRDRDRLRVQALERLGWRVHRIWAADWLHDADAEVARVRAALDAAVQGAASPVRARSSAVAPGGVRAVSVGAGEATDSRPDLVGGPAGAPAGAFVGTATAGPAAVATDGRVTPPGERGPRPDVPPGRSIESYTDAQLDALVRWVESDTLLRTEDELLVAMLEELGFRRRGSRIVATLEAAIRRVRAGG